MIVQWPLNQVTQLPWEYERKTQTINGQDVQLYSIVLKDYDGSGAIDGEDIRWIGNNSDYEWRNMPDIGGKKAQRLFQGVQLTFTKRYSSRWQMMGSLLFNHSSGMAGRNKRQDQDYNMEGTNIWSDRLAGAASTRPSTTWKAPCPSRPVRIQGRRQLHHPQDRGGPGPPVPLPHRPAGMGPGGCPERSTSGTTTRRIPTC